MSLQRKPGTVGIDAPKAVKKYFDDIVTVMLDNGAVEADSIVGQVEGPEGSFNIRTRVTLERITS